MKAMTKSSDKATRVTRRLSLSVLCLTLGACAHDDQAKLPRPSVVVLPQVVYRIDEHRYFEVTPERNCYGDMIYFVDTKKGIRSAVVKFDPVMNRTTLIIDAANDQYLVAPVTRGGLNCSSGGGGCEKNTMPYSTDGGRTWNRAWIPSTDGVSVSSNTAYYQDDGSLWHSLDLALSKPEASDWKYVRRFALNIQLAPIDNRVRCNDIGRRSLQ